MSQCWLCFFNWCVKLDLFASITQGPHSLWPTVVWNLGGCADSCTSECHYFVRFPEDLGKLINFGFKHIVRIKIFLDFLVLQVTFCATGAVNFFVWQFLLNTLWRWIGRLYSCQFCIVAIYQLSCYIWRKAIKLSEV